MRFSFAVAAVTLMLAAGHAPAQEAEPPDAAEPAGESEAQPPAFDLSDKACEVRFTPEFEAALGEPVAWPNDGETVHTPAGVTKLGHAVSYVLVKRDDAGKVFEVGFRLAGMGRVIGQPHDSRLLRAFDDAFDGADCARSRESSCGVAYRPSGGNTFVGAQIGSGEVYIGPNARGPSLSLVEADFDALDADPVFLVCFYRSE